MQSPEVIPYASPPMVKARVTYRGGITTLIVGGSFLVLSIILMFIAWSMFERIARSFNSSIEMLGTFVAALSGISFVCGMIVAFMGLRDVRRRETE